MRYTAAEPTPLAPCPRRAAPPGTLALAVLLSLQAACVTQKTYDALAAQRDELELSIADRNAAVAALEKRVGRMDDEKRQLETALAAEKEKVVDLAARLERLRSEMAQTAKQKSRLEASLEDLTRALVELEQRRTEAEARVAEFRALISKFRSLIDAGKLQVRIVDGRMVLVLATDVLFASGSASLSRDGRAAVSEVARVLASIPKRAFQVEGHTDNVPIATAQYPSNWELAAARALNVVKTMVDAGLPPERLSAASYADARPAASNDTPDGKAQNRRIEIALVPDLSMLPGFEELRQVETPGAGEPRGQPTRR